MEEQTEKLLERLKTHVQYWDAKEKRIEELTEWEIELRYFARVAIAEAECYIYEHSTTDEVLDRLLRE